MKKTLFCVLALILALGTLPAMAQGGGGVDGYAFWLPSGELTVGHTPSDVTNPTEKYFKYESTATTETLTLHPKTCRWGAPWGQFVIIRKGATTTPEFTVDGKSAGKLGKVTFIPLEMGMTKEGGGKDPTTIVVNAPSVKGSTYLIYWTDDALHLGTTINGIVDGAKDPWGKGITAFWSGDYETARSEFLKGEKSAKTPDAKREYRRLARWAAAYTKFSTIKTGPGYYNLGMYCMTNGFWDLAADTFRKATELMPKDADAAFMLADGLSYKWGDNDTKEQAVYPYYKKAADLYPRDGSNTFHTWFALCRNMKVNDGQGGTTVLHITQDQIDQIKRDWEWCSVIMEGASKGTFRMKNTYDVIDREIDGVFDYDVKPFEGDFKPGTVDGFIKMTNWGASDTCGMDCGPNRSSYVTLGPTREWEVALHEWNHQLDWSMIFSELGIGVPDTHSSDWCGFEPISCMGMGHHSCNRYYMTPGMYLFDHGSAPITTPFVTDWMMSSSPVTIAPPKTADELKAGGKPMDDFYTDLYAKTKDATPPSSFAVKPKITALGTNFMLKGEPAINGYVDFNETYGGASPKNGYAFAETYVYSPTKQKVGMWVASDDNIKIWQNGRLIRKGVYWTCALWTDCKEPCQNSSAIMLEKGWNRLTVQITNRQHGVDWLGGDPPDQWGFSIRFCTVDNKEVSGLKYQTEKPEGYKDVPPFVVDPKNPKAYKWSEVRDDYTFLLPQLTIDDLRAITGYKTLTATTDIFWDLTKENLDPSIKQYVLDKPDPKNVTFNNELNWYFSPKEMTAFIRYKRDGKTRDLLFIKNEARDPFTQMVPVSKAAEKLGIKSNDAQVIGYFEVDYGGLPNGRGVIVVDTYLGDKVPTDEEDLMDIDNLK